VKLKREYIDSIAIQKPTREKMTSVMCVEDKAWVNVDAKGHKHRWIKRNGKYTITGCTKSVKATLIDDYCECCGSKTQETEYDTVYTCDKCGEAIAPQYTDEIVSVWISTQEYTTGQILASGDDLEVENILEPFELADVSDEKGTAYIESCDTVWDGKTLRATIDFRVIRTA